MAWCHLWLNQQHSRVSARVWSLQRMVSDNVIAFLNAYILPYILAYKPTILGWILTIKLWGSAYTWVMPHSHTLTARVCMAWTIGRPLGLCVGVVRAWRAVRPHTDCCVCIPVKSSTVTWYHCHCHVHACFSHCCELVHTRAFSTHRFRILVHCWFSLPAYMRLTNFCHIFGRGKGDRRVYTVHLMTDNWQQWVSKQVCKSVITFICVM